MKRQFEMQPYQEQRLGKRGTSTVVTLGLLEQICMWMGMIISRVDHAEEEGNE